MQLQNHLVIFAKLPRLYKVKRRLGTEIGHVPALNFYRATLLALIRRIRRGAKWRTWLAITPDSAVNRHDLWPRKLTCIAQGTGDLGDRMARAVKMLPPGKAIIIGSDIPDITTRMIVQAFNQLNQADVVLGPAEDGGYWLIGLNKKARKFSIFKNIRWSTSHVLKDTILNISSDSKICYIDLLRDIDDGNAFFNWRKTHQFQGGKI